MAPRIDGPTDLTINIRTAIAQARRLNLPTSVYLLSMVELDIWQALPADLQSQEHDQTE